MDTRGKGSQGRGTSMCKAWESERAFQETLKFPNTWVLCSAFIEIPKNEILKNPWMGN